MEKIPEELRPICSCGKRMIVVHYKGYYDEFSYFGCAYCELMLMTTNQKAIG